MVGTARREIVRDGEIGTYHCWSKCTQRAFLCGYDRVTEIDFDYRRQWLEGLVRYQAGVFAVDVGNFSVLSNHTHWIIRLRPDVAATWPDEEVVWRWKLAWPIFFNGAWGRQVPEQEVAGLLSQPEEVQRIRRNLSSLSWFMARVKEPMARLCNAEMGVDGHFWAQRFGCRELLDEASVLACHIYVDLNQLNAGMAGSLEGARHSAIYNRLTAAKAREVVASVEAFAATSDERVHQLPPETVEALFADCWLAPICADGPLITGTGAGAEGLEPPGGLVLPSEALADAGPDGEAPPTAGGVEAEPMERDVAVEVEAGEACSAPVNGPEDAEPTKAPGPVMSAEEWEAAPGVEQPAAVASAEEERPEVSGLEPAGMAEQANSGPGAGMERPDGVGNASGEASGEVGLGQEAAAAADGSTSTPVRGRPARARASDNPILAMPLEQYLTVVQQLAALALARRLGAGPSGPPAEACPEALAILEAYGVNGEACLIGLEHLETQCRRAFGAASRVEARAREAAQRWFQGIGLCREIFVERPEAEDGHT